MKVKKLYMILLCVVLASSVFASGKMQTPMKQSTQNWTQDVQTSDRDGVIGDNDLNQYTPDPQVPLGDTAWVVILGMGLIYGVSLVLRKGKEANQ